VKKTWTSYVNATEKSRTVGSDINADSCHEGSTILFIFFQEKLEELMIPRLVVPAGRKPHIVQYLINKKLHPIVRQRHSMFERVYSVSVNMANKLLDSGYKLLSRFGRWCPVAVRRSSAASFSSQNYY